MPYENLMGDEIFLACDRHNDEIETLRKILAEDGLSNFSLNLRIVALKLFELI